MAQKRAEGSDERIGAAIQRLRRAKAFSEVRGIASYEHAASGKVPAALLTKEEIVERMDGFADWMGRYLEADAETRKGMETEGYDLAKRRWPAMVELIQLDPELAIDLAVDRTLRPQLPRSIVALLESHVSGRSRYDVHSICGFGESNTANEVIREVTVNGESKRVFTFGRRLGVTMKEDLPFHGVSLDNLVAMHESPVRRIDPAELPASQQPSAGEVAIDVGGQMLTVMASRAIEIEGEMQRREDELTPSAALGLLPSGQFSAPYARSARTEGPKTALLIRVRFSDDPLPGGAPLDDATMAARAMDYAQYWEEVSYGRSTLTPTITPVLTSTATMATHATLGVGGIINDGAAAAAAAGFDPDDFDFVSVFTKSAGHGYCGVAGVGGKFSHNVCFNIRTVNHEFGHNLGLFHANYNYTSHPTDPTSRDAVAGASESPHLEYGHWYSVQSGQNPSRMDLRAHYAAPEKVRIDWLRDNEFTDVRSSGTYRINQLDHMDSQGVRGLRVPTGDAARQYYWINFRTAYTTDDWLSNSAQFDWASENYGGEGILMLDMTPQSNDGPVGNDNNDKPDSGLLIGRTYHESRADVYITPIGKGGARPDEWLDVQVNFGPFPDNNAPEVTVTPQFSDVAVGELVNLTANAVDPDQEPVAYDWDFDDGSFDPAVLNQPMVSHAFSAPGIYVVRVTVSDMKGGATVGSAVVRVGAASGDIVLVDNAIISEGDSGISKVRVGLTMVEPALTAITLDYATQDGTAKAGEDYNATSGTVTIEAGEASQSIEIEVLGDVKLEGNENFFVQFTNGAGVILAPDRAPVTIADDEHVEAAPVIDSVTPNKGPVGSEVVISGSGFALFKDDNVVYFGGVRARVVSVANDTMITVEVPTGATYAPITVSIGEFSSASPLPFVVTFDGDTELGQMAFDSSARFATGLLPSAVAVGDLDNDGRPELVTANADAATFSVFRNTSAANSVTLGSFEQKKDFGAGAGPSEAAVADFDGDGVLDVAIVNAVDETISVYRNTSSLGVIGFASRVDLATGSNPSGLAVADIDGNGRFDILVANRSASSISVFPNTGVQGSIDANTFGARVNFIVGTEPAAVAAADLDGDGRPEIVAANSFDGAGGHSLTILGNGAAAGGQFSKSSMTTAAVLPLVDGVRLAEVALADLDADGRLDIVSLDAAGATVWVHRNETVQATPTEDAGPLLFTEGNSPYSFASGLSSLDMAIGDLDGDDWPDIAVVNDALNQVGILRNEGMGAIGFDARVAVNVEKRPQALALVDVDLNGKPDIVTAHWGNVIEINRNAVKTGVRIDWADLPGLTYGEPLGEDQLDAGFKLLDGSPLAADAGTLVYLPPLGTVLDAGEHTLKVTFVPSDASSHSGVDMEATVTVGKKTLTLTPRDAQRELGQPNPTFTASYAGFVGSDDEEDLDTQPVLTTTADLMSDVGMYPITVANAMELLTGDNNYVVEVDEGATPMLTIVTVTPDIVWADPAAIRYGTLLSATQLNAVSSAPGGDDPANFDYQVGGEPALGQELLPGFNQEIEVTFTSTDPNYAPKTVTVEIDVLRGMPEIVWPETQEPIGFGVPLDESQLNAKAYKPGSGQGVEIEGDFTYTPDAGTVLSTGSGRKLTVTFEPEDTMLYVGGVIAHSEIDITPTKPVIEWAELEPITFGDALSAETHLNAEEASRLNGDEEDDIAGSFTYSVSAGAVLNAGEHIIVATFTPVDTINVQTVTAERTLVVEKATPTIVWGDMTLRLSDMVYGEALTAQQLNATVEGDIPGVFRYENLEGSEVGIGDLLPGGENQGLNAVFTPADTQNYDSATALVLVTVTPADPTITHDAPDSIVYGTPLSPELLGLTSSAEGEFTFKDDQGSVLIEEGLVLEAGPHDITVEFEPAEGVAGNFNGANLVVSLTVVQATPEIVWAQPEDIIFGVALGETLLNATAVVAGTDTEIPGDFEYYHDGTRAEDKVLNAGNSQRLTAMFAPHSANYKSAQAHVFIDVIKATPVIEWGDERAQREGDELERLVDIVYGTPLGADQLNASVSLNDGPTELGSLLYSIPAGTMLPAGDYELQVVYVPADAKNYNLAEATVLLAVTRKALTITAEDKSKAEGVELPELTAVYDGFIDGDSVASLTTPAALSTEATAASLAGEGSLMNGDYLIEVSGAASPNYEITHVNGALTVVGNQAPTVAITAPVDGKVVSAMSSLTLRADASDADGSVAKVEFFAGTTSLGVATVAPYSVVWAKVPIGTHSLTAVATDDLNQTSTSAEVSLVAQAGVNQATVDGEADQVSIALTGESGITYAFQASSDLKTWTTLRVFVATGDTETLPDPDPGAAEALYKFYRIIPVSELP